jgi:ABC-type transport system involved in multi-copper enzyme maturation permease subunit
MTLLPLVERELRVAARRRSTYMVRLFSTAVVFILTAMLLITKGIFGSSANLGPFLFTVLSVYAFVFCNVAAVFLTADCLSEEKREGTLGLLFLTDLQGYDVVLGKFVARALNAFYALLAALPMLAIPVTMGGVTGAQFWSTTLALVNALFFALALGMAVSALSRESGKAMGNTFALLLLVNGVLPLAGQIFGRTGPARIFTDLVLLSPGQAFFGVFVPSHFWQTLLASNLLGWLFLGLAAWALPRNWHEEPVKEAVVARPRRWFQKLARQDGSYRGALLDNNPVLWLAQSRAARPAVIWTLAALAALPEVAGFGGLGPFGGFFAVLALPLQIFPFLFKFLLARQACLVFAEARQNNALETVLGTALTTKEIIQGQWQALRRLFLWPFVLLVVLRSVLTYVQLIAMIKAMGALPWVVTNLGGAGMVLGLITLVFDFFALGWMGMWMALKCKKPQHAAAWTMFFVIVLPSVFMCGMRIITDVIFFSVFRGKVLTHLRAVALPEYRALLPAVPPPLRTDPHTPPVIAR